MPDPTTLLLIRHGQTDWIAKGVAGRLPDVHLNDEGATGGAARRPETGTFGVAGACPRLMA
jgi:bisphosphoglycerate-dependent phosphoglycerate mutase